MHVHYYHACMHLPNTQRANGNQPNRVGPRCVSLPDVGICFFVFFLCFVVCRFRVYCGGNKPPSFDRTDIILGACENI